MQERRKELFWASSLKRENVIGKAILNLFGSITSYPRLLLEVFIRRDMGVRYFSLATVFTIAFLLMLYPFAQEVLHNLDSDYYYSKPNMLTKYAGWWLFIGLFLYFSYFRYRETYTGTAIFYLGRFSLSSGSLWPLFFAIRPFGRKPSVRTVETVYEPAFFFIIGIILWLLTQPVGKLLLVSSVLYSLSYLAAYKKGDDYILDINDKAILAEDFERDFVDGEEGPTTNRGARVRMTRPDDEEARRKIMEDTFGDDDEDATVAR